MIRSLEVTGFFGGVRMGGRAAAEFKRWKMTGNEAGFHIAAECTHIDSFLLELDATPEVRIVLGEKSWGWKHGRDVPMRGLQEVSLYWNEEAMTVDVRGRGRPTIG